MKAFFLLVFLFVQTICFAQNISGKWYGKLTQKAGGYSQLYDLELSLSQKKKITGQSSAFIESALSVIVGLKGSINGDSIRLSESIYDIQKEKLPADWILCIKNYNLKYYRQGNDEFLKGTWNGIAKNDGSDCIPGEIILSKSTKALEEFITKDGFQQPYLIDTLPALNELTTEFLKTSVKKVKQIEVHHKYIEFLINDYLHVDNDTVSVYLNRNLIVNKQRISKKQLRVSIKIDSRLPLNEILLFAENLGNIPPNTSQIVIIDGTNTHRLVIESDKQKSAALYLKYIP